MRELEGLDPSDTLNTLREWCACAAPYLWAMLGPWNMCGIVVCIHSLQMVSTAPASLRHEVVVSHPRLVTLPYSLGPTSVVLLAFALTAEQVASAHSIVYAAAVTVMNFTLTFSLAVLVIKYSRAAVRPWQAAAKALQGDRQPSAGNKSLPSWLV